MSKAYLFLETGEVREPKSGDWHVSPFDGAILTGDGNYTPRPILTRYEIEIPEGATFMEFGYWKEGSFYNLTVGHSEKIPLPRPKKKVKRYQWLYRTRTGCHVSSKTYSEKEAKDEYSRDLIRPIPETEIEVEL